MPESFEVRRILPATPERVFRAWLDAQEHSAMTGGAYRDLGDGSFTAWAGYIQGKTLEQEPPLRIVQFWRTTEFPPEAPDSRLEVVLAPADGGTEVLLRHSEVPEGQGEAYRSGWEEHYFDPMEEYFLVPTQSAELDDDEFAGASAQGMPAEGDSSFMAPHPVTDEDAPADASRVALMKASQARAKKAAAKKAKAKKAPASKAAAKKAAPAKKAPAKKAAAKKAAPAKKAPAKKAATKATAKAAKKPAAKKKPGRR